MLLDAQKSKKLANPSPARFFPFPNFHRRRAAAAAAAAAAVEGDG